MINNQKPVNLIAISAYIDGGKDTVGKIIQWLTRGNNKNPEFPVTVLEYLSGTKGKLWDNGWGDLVESVSILWEVKKFAAKLKQIASLLTGVPAHMFDNQDFKKLEMGEEWKRKVKYGMKRTTEVSNPNVDPHLEQVPTYRQFLQELGTEAIRNQIHPNAWANALFADYKPLYEGEVLASASGFNLETSPIYSNWVITDLRFPNEAKAVEERGGVTVRLCRGHYYSTFIDSLGRGTHVWGTSLDPKDGVTLSIHEGTKWEAYKKFLQELNKLTPKHESETALDDWDFDYYIENNGTLEELVEEVRKMLVHFKILEP